tara:strand:- start:189 stop:413 length:225 start_codon:yes stop_codon:yes gene_type:complete
MKGDMSQFRVIQHSLSRPENPGHRTPLIDPGYYLTTTLGTFTFVSIFFLVDINTMVNIATLKQDSNEFFCLSHF